MVVVVVNFFVRYMIEHPKINKGIIISCITNNTYIHTSRLAVWVGVVMCLSTLNLFDDIIR